MLLLLVSIVLGTDVYNYIDIGTFVLSMHELQRLKSAEYTHRIAGGIVAHIYYQVFRDIIGSYMLTNLTAGISYIF